MTDDEGMRLAQMQAQLNVMKSKYTATHGQAPPEPTPSQDWSKRIDWQAVKKRGGQEAVDAMLKKMWDEPPRQP